MNIVAADVSRLTRFPGKVRADSPWLLRFSRSADFPVIESCASADQEVGDTAGWRSRLSMNIVAADVSRLTLFPGKVRAESRRLIRCGRSADLQVIESFASDV